APIITPFNGSTFTRPAPHLPVDSAFDPWSRTASRAHASLVSPGEASSQTPPLKTKIRRDRMRPFLIIRSLLCRLYNLALGNMKDDIALLRKAIAYLEKHQ